MNSDLIQSVFCRERSQRVQHEPCSCSHWSCITVGSAVKENKENVERRFHEEKDAV